MFNPSDLGNFYGSENFYRYPMAHGMIFTDGVAFLMKNGAHWLCSDAMIVCAMEPKVRKEEFISIKAKVKDGKCIVTYDDGNGKIKFKQEYDGTDLPCDVNFYCENGTFMLVGER
jgi:hypothetical protein